ncbi:hypothetical protein RAS1_27330 [Phycisphaerae bacterium RAS1]|nr:hypothetical protein RAS1_27330 [Phycisphaerae bacterium RAS1]
MRCLINFGGGTGILPVPDAAGTGETPVPPGFYPRLEGADGCSHGGPGAAAKRTTAEPVACLNGVRAMGRFVALYRGINVVGNNRVKMESLRAMHERLRHHAVQSYIQSGNVVFEAGGAAENIARKIATRFVEEFGFAARVMVLPAVRWAALVRANPYTAQSAALPQTVHAGICDGEPDAEALRALLTRTGGSESFSVRAGVVYLHAPDGFGTSKFAAGMEKACGVAMTVRNWRTVEALAKILDGSEPSLPR